MDCPKCLKPMRKSIVFEDGHAVYRCPDCGHLAVDNNSQEQEEEEEEDLPPSPFDDIALYLEDWR